MWHLLSVSFNGADTRRMEEIAYFLILVAGVFLASGAGIPFAGRSSRSIAGVSLAVAGVLLLAATRWGTG